MAFVCSTEAGTQKGRGELGLARTDDDSKSAAILCDEVQQLHNLFCVYVLLSVAKIIRSPVLSTTRIDSTSLESLSHILDQHRRQPRIGGLSCSG